MKEAWLHAVAARIPIEIEYRIHHHVSGEWRWTLAQAAPVRENDGSVREWVGMNTDITVRKRAEEELARFNRAAVGRETRMIELKKEINELCRRHGEDARYPLDFESDGDGSHG